MATIEQEDEDDNGTKELKCLLTVLEEKIRSPSQLIVALTEASQELCRYHVFTLMSWIQIYMLFSGTGSYRDQPYQKLYYNPHKLNPSAETVSQRQGDSLGAMSGTRSSSLLMPGPRQSETSILLSEDSTATNHEATKRRAAPLSETNGEPYNKKKNISSAGLENEQQMPNVDVVGPANCSRFQINPAVVSEWGNWRGTSINSSVALQQPNVSMDQHSDLPVRQYARQPSHQLQTNNPFLQYAQVQPSPITGGNPFTTGVLTEAMNNLQQTSQSPTTSWPMTQLEQQSPSNRQVIPSDRSDSSRQTEQFDRRLTAQVRSVHELQSGTSSDTLAGGQHLQPEPTISGEPSSSRVGGPSTDRPPREADRSVIIEASRMVVQESSVEPEFTAPEVFDSSASSAWRGGSTSGDINGLQTPLSISEGQAGLSSPLMPSSEQMETLRPNVSTDPSEETNELSVQTIGALAKIMNEQHNQAYSLLRNISQRLPPGLRDSSSFLGESSGSSQLPRCHPSTSADPLSSLQDHEKQAILVYKDKTDDRVALVKELVPIFFTEEERRTQNCQGKGLCDGKDEFTQLSKEKLQKMREIIFYLCPVRSIKERETVEEKEWKRLCSEIDLFNRHFRGNLTRQAKSKSKRRKSDK